MNAAEALQILRAGGTLRSDKPLPNDLKATDLSSTTAQAVRRIMARRAAAPALLAPSTQIAPLP